MAGRADPPDLTDLAMMLWAVALLGLVLTVFGATAAAALITASRAQLADVVQGAAAVVSGNTGPAHLAAANAQCAALHGAQALAIFSGPHAYITPGWYRTQPAVPTWDYAAVHVHGVLEPVADEAQTAAMIEHTVATYGRLDMAFNNAGIVGFTGNLADESAESFDEVTAINLRGIWTCMKHELRQMRTQGSGAIVNCSSLGGLVGQAGRASYHAMKHGVIGLTKSAALDYAAHGIRINAVCPGVIDTPMGGGMGPDAIQEIMRDQPIARLGHPDEIAAAVLWLCSPGASFVLGVALPVDGGFTAH